MFAVLFKHIHTSFMTLKFLKTAETFLRSATSFIKKKKKVEAYITTCTVLNKSAVFKLEQLNMHNFWNLEIWL